MINSKIKSINAKVFISGPMRGIPEWNEPEFMKAEKMLTKKGYAVFNPAWMKFSEGWDVSDILPIDIAALSRCDIIYMLNGWEKSSGATLEHNFALKTGMCIMYQSEEK